MMDNGFCAEQCKPSLVLLLSSDLSENVKRARVKISRVLIAICSHARTLENYTPLAITRRAVIDLRADNRPGYRCIGRIRVAYEAPSAEGGIDLNGASRKSTPAKLVSPSKCIPHYTQFLSPARMKSSLSRIHKSRNFITNLPPP